MNKPVLSNQLLLLTLILPPARAVLTVLPTPPCHDTPFPAGSQGSLTQERFEYTDYMETN